MADYRLTETDVVIRTADSAHIPNDPANRDRIAFEQWLADGGVPEPFRRPINPALDSLGTSRTAAQILGAT